MKKLILEDCDQDLTFLIVEEEAGFLKIKDVPKWCSHTVKKLYVDMWIDPTELVAGESFAIVDPRNGFTGFRCKWNFESIEEFGQLKRNQKVRLTNCPEREVYPNVVFTVKCDSYDRGLNGENIEVTKLKEIGGEWHVECLQPLTQNEVNELNKSNDNDKRRI